MPFITWDSGLSVGVEEIDRQHKKLFDLVNDLYDAMREGKGNEIVGTVLRELHVYTVTHFQFEEKLFRQTGYPGSVNHKMEHDALIQRVDELQSKFDSGKVALHLEVLNLLKDWLNQHIRNSDRAYSVHLNSRGIY
ncbi:MAG: bacteriohemerythrin [Ignavibacteria bacterium]|nr:bacteriohemerythrin [Ignavibacteria bacterium]